MPDFVICARNVSGKTFDTEPGTTNFIIVPDKELPSPTRQENNAAPWVKHAS